MDTIDNSRSNLPAQLSAPLSLKPLSVPPLSGELATASMPQINSQVLLRGLTRHWHWILLLWLVISVPVIYLISVNVVPTYEAFSTIRIEPTQPELFSPAHNSFVESRAVRPYLETQVNVMVSNHVLEQAVANPQVVNLPFVRQSEDPKADLRKKMSVSIMDNANMIRVGLELADPNQAATIVNTVVEAYMVQNTIFNRSLNKNLQETLKAELDKLEDKLKTTRTEMEKMVKEGNFKIDKPTLNPHMGSDDDQSVQPAFSEMTETQYDNTLGQITRVENELIEAQALLDTLEKNAEKRVVEQANAERSGKGDDQLQERIDREFSKDPDVVALSNEIANTREQLERAKSATRKNTPDASVIAANKHLNSLGDQWRDLWEEKYPEILKRLRSGENGSPAKDATAIAELRLKIEALKKKRDGYVSMLQTKLVETKKTSTDHFNAIMVNHDLNSLLSKKDSVTRNLEQLKFEAEQDNFRVFLLDSASVPRIASNNKRLKYMAAAPLAILFMMIGLFLLLEIKAERVADPDFLSTRVRSEVYSLPPLPTPRSMRKLSPPAAEEELEQFIQRLDHLRFAICGTAAELGKGRCVLITSAIGGEGKTSLAAQLAGNCGSAKMSTLLIDADLRRASLCKLLDVPDGLGLTDLLQDECALEEAIIPVQEGAYYLLRSGTATKAITRLLQSRKCEQLICQLRQFYDLVIIDSPPVLPVPDALILGQWADGAVLAARYDISRFPQVERARRQLDSAGIAILGTVINGMKHSDAYYGRYSYRRRSTSSDSSNTN
jgi:succinoglycan biosynthesis transport protein ExoP